MVLLLRYVAIKTIGGCPEDSMADQNAKSIWGVGWGLRGWGLKIHFGLVSRTLLLL